MLPPQPLVRSTLSRAAWLCAWLLLIAPALLCPGVVRAQDEDEEDDIEEEIERRLGKDIEEKIEEAEKKAEKAVLDTLAAVKKSLDKEDTLFEVSYRKPDEKGRLRTTKAIVEIPEKLEVLRDRRIALEDLGSDDTVWVLGRPVEREVRGGGPGGGGVGGGVGGVGGQGYGKDRQIQAARVILVGDELEVNESYKDRRDDTLKWCKATVKMVKGGLWVEFNGDEYRVTLDKGAPILRREKCERKFLGKAKYVHVKGRLAKQKPDTGRSSDAELDAFQVGRVILVERSLLTRVYPALFR